MIPINAVSDGCAKTLLAHYHKAGGDDFNPGNGGVKHTAILEMEMEEARPIQVAQIYDKEENPMNGRVYDADGIASTLRTPTGGLSEPKIAVSCALRGRNPNNPSDRTAGINTEQRLEIGSDVANCVTTVQKDSMLLEPIKIRQATVQGYIECPVGGGQIPMIVQMPHGYNSGGLRNGEVSPAITTSSWESNNMLVEPCGCYDNQFGEFAREPLEGLSRTVKTDGHNAVLLSRKDDVVFKEMPDGNIHAYRANDPKKSTAPEWQITNADNVHPTITTSHEPKVLLKYRIRKLTPTECFRLMGMDDADIEKIDAYRIKTVLKSGKVKEKPIPKSAKYKLAGNSIVVDVLYHIFHKMFIAEPPQQKSRQLSLFDDL
uniref:Cyt C5 DNA methylase n=1 Tax=Dulem virus 40 TaxID=3145758 RepID=A0AAU8AXQ8_9CAUD